MLRKIRLAYEICACVKKAAFGFEICACVKKATFGLRNLCLCYEKYDWVMKPVIVL